MLLLTTCTALFVSAYLRAGHQVSVLAVARPVAQGATVSASDLVVVRLSASGRLTPVPAAQAAAVVGRRAAVALLPGSLLTMSDLANVPRLAPGQAVVGVALKPSQLPADGVFPGESVDVILTGLPDTGGAASGTNGAPALSATVLAPQVLVTAVDVPDQTSPTGTVDVSLLVPHDLAGVVASASVAGQVALVVIGGSS